MTDSARALREAELTSEEIDRILRICGPHALLVGGQALATWALYYNVQPVSELSRAITMDADFIGTRNIARALQLQKTIRDRASQLMLADGITIHVLHPLDVLESRLSNLAFIPAKQNAIGVAQARLAVSVVRAFIESHMDAGGDPRIVRQAIKRVEKIALDTQLCRVAFGYGIDVLAAVPVERIAYPRFHQDQWPRVLQRLESKRKKFVALQGRRTALRARRAASADKK